MSEAAVFLWFFSLLFVLRIIAATFVYSWLLSEAPECPSCGGETVRIERRGIDWLFPRLRPSWCPECGWEGLLHPVPRAPGERTHERPPRPPQPAAPAERTVTSSGAATNAAGREGERPLISKKPSQ